MANIPMASGTPSWSAKTDISVFAVPPKLPVATADEGCSQGYHRYHDGTVADSRH